MKESDNNIIALGGIKHDSDKPDLSILPRSGLEGIAKVFSFGEKKYGRYNFLKGMAWSRITSAAMRHLVAFNDGEDLDNESKLNHLYHAGACIMMLAEYYEKKLGQDNRYKK